VGVSAAELAQFPLVLGLDTFGDLTHDEDDRPLSHAQRLSSRQARTRIRQGTVPVASPGQDAVALVRELATSLAKIFAQVVLDGAGAAVQPGADLRVQVVAGQPRDLGLLRG
jgi:hypothetical protein